MLGLVVVVGFCCLGGWFVDGEASDKARLFVDCGVANAFDLQPHSSSFMNFPINSNIRMGSKNLHDE